jgi:hypothetical protein
MEENVKGRENFEDGKENAKVEAEIGFGLIVDLDIGFGLIVVVAFWGCREWGWGRRPATCQRRRRWPALGRRC